VAGANEWFIERMGLAAETDGLSRIAGRLFGALLLSEEPRSLDDLAESLGVSKASASVDARRLLDRGVAERVGKPGDRRDYYQLAPDFFARLTRHRLARWAALHELVAEMRERDARTHGARRRPAAIRDRFAYVDDVQAFVLERVHDALREWEEAHRDGGVDRRTPAAGRHPARGVRGAKRSATRQTKTSGRSAR
jgi:DNA-binding MarR family transcriptional regulator